ncbi:uncharacterized protein FOMMEDRAFT_31644 [Fomitiporia mediterranea MF3/22]|uniref:uncharacterized protein n=1 Tax=Fomitiporia mediterranea (strain MF3/22) TaxID=694068 RepID=UPI00044096CA|nr:uncharacterized protein FOMMEDRAFT_31644 [Fomitiporia mediterranea MF3/22]EJC98598.1 hypothetical protein FOMMEDRAFT_31644 [Fomitiporia mediterranea MF3/22]
MHFKRSFNTRRVATFCLTQRLGLGTSHLALRQERMSCDDEPSLRAHLRELLLEYAYTHLTVDYMEYSRSLVSGISDKILKPIPTHEPGQLVLPTDPFDDLKKKFKFDNLTAYDEVLEPNPETMQLLKRIYSAPKGRPRTQTVWEEEDDFEYETMPHRPMTPILSRSSRNKTPSLGKRVRKKSLATFVSSHGVLGITNEDVPEEKPIKIEDCLDTKLVVDPSIVSDLDKCIQGNPFLCRTAPRIPSHATEFLRSVSPVYQEKFKPMSPPVFPRVQRSRPFKVKSKDSILGQINLAPVEVDDDEPDIANANMSIIDGWTTIPTSTSTPSLSSGASDVDELEEEADFWKPSSEGGSGDKAILHEAKMEEPIFPRAKRPRAGAMSKADGKQKISLSTFISSRLPHKSVSRGYTCSDSDDAARTLSGPPSAAGISESMLGQPPSESDVPSASPGHSAGDSLDREIRKMLKAHGGYAKNQSYQDIILNERLDDKESMFMNVPKLSPPNEYLRKSRGKGVTKPGSKSEGTTNKPNFVLPITPKKVSGLKSLNLELSWRPFSYGAKIPTHTDLLGVESLLSIDDNLRDEQNAPITSDSVEKILAGLSISANFEDQAQSINTIDRTNEHFLKDIISDIDLNSIYPRFDPNRDFDDDNTYLLSRSDRRALAMHQLNQHYTTANEILPFDDSQSNETLDCSSAITPEFDAQFQGTQNIAETSAYTHISQPNVDGLSARERDNNYDDDDYHYACDEQDNSHLKKRRRLSNAELDALCAMETMSQSCSLTVDPKDLTLLPTDNFSYTLEHNTDFLSVIPVQNSQCTLASSESLSLSLSEDNLPQKSLTLKVADDPMAITEETHGAYGERRVALGIHREAVNDDEFRALKDQQEDVSVLDYELQQHQRLYPSECPPVERGFTPEVQPARPTVDQQDVSRTGRTGVHSNGNSIRLKNLEGPQHASFSASPYHSLSTFLHARGRKNISTSHKSALVPEDPEPSCDVRDTESGHAENESYRVYYSAPPELLSDTRAFTIPDTWEPPTIEHAYLVSVDLLQQQALVRALESHCAIQLKERDTVSPPFIPTSVPISPQPFSAEISLIVGPDAGVVFFPLSAIPSQNAYKTLLDALAFHSWRFSHILLVLMAFPRSRLMRAASLDEEDRDGPSSYSPPVLKAARRIRRDLGLREGTGEKHTGCTVELAFADNVEHAAKLVRAFGDTALRDSVVDYTQYIGEEEQEGERDLAELEGMNTYCAAVILRCCTLEEFLEMHPKHRTEGLVDLIGKERIERVNAILNRRIQVMDLDLPSSSEFSSLN